MNLVTCYVLKAGSEWMFARWVMLSVLSMALQDIGPHQIMQSYAQ
ncbi:hypothetical protein [Comamonas testosteroni]|nr:hypothetical protein [Comamonas testosteroni]